MISSLQLCDTDGERLQLIRLALKKSQQAVFSILKASFGRKKISLHILKKYIYRYVEKGQFYLNIL